MDKIDDIKQIARDALNYLIILPEAIFEEILFI